MDWASVVLILLAVGLGIVWFAVLLSSRIPQQESEALLKRLEELAAKEESATIEEIEMALPFSERVVYPFLRKLGERATRNTKKNVLLDIERKIILAGRSGSLEPSMLLSTRFIVMLIFAAFTFLMAKFTILNQSYTQSIVYALIAGLLGYNFPVLWLNGEVKKRQQAIRKEMPDALDLLTICVEAGLGFDAAMSKVASKWDNELSQAFAITIKEMQLGKIRREALKNMADRIDIPEMTSFVAALIQSEQLGVSLSKVLHIQSEQMRIFRRQTAEEKAHGAPVKMLLPMMALIFPSIFIVILTPAVLKFMRMEVFK